MKGSVKGRNVVTNAEESMVEPTGEASSAHPHKGRRSRAVGRRLASASVGPVPAPRSIARRQETLEAFTVLLVAP